MKIREIQLPEMTLAEHRFRVPLDSSDPSGEGLELFAREVRAKEVDADDREVPWLIFLQGGPGCGGPRPTSRSGWIKRALEPRDGKGHRVLLLDQRGTGKSTPVSAATMKRLGTPQAQADYLKHFRMDAIVRDCELLRAELLGAEGRWRVLGQSFGGFCLTHYLSTQPDHLDGGYFTGGLPKLDAHADDVYRQTYAACAQKNEQFYARYPEDDERVRRLAAHLEEEEVFLVGGDRLRARHLQQLGMFLGGSSGFEDLHHLLELAFDTETDKIEIGLPFLRGVQNAMHWDVTPLYSVLHEGCYTQGSASRWSAWRVREEFPAFDLQPNERLLFTGEMISPWMFEDYAALRPFAECAELLAQYEEWPMLYDSSRLAANQVPAAAAVYSKDMYVPFEYSMETAKAIRGLGPWVSDRHEHNGLRADGARILDELLRIAHGKG